MDDYSKLMWRNFEIDKRAVELERKLRVAELKNANSLANNLCPDHRDKQADKPCLACSLETAERKLRVAEEALEIISGERSCVDNLMGNADIARAALAVIRGE